jgi:nitrogenase molybdenum-cofactor synthesis protein NifE
MVKLVAEIDKALFNPMWEQLRQPAPWDTAGVSWQSKAIVQEEAEAAALAADPVVAEQARRAKKICNCKSVELGAIEDAILTDGLMTVDSVRERTGVSGGCGMCAGRVEDILAALGVPAGLPAIPFLQAAE